MYIFFGPHLQWNSSCFQLPAIEVVVKLPPPDRDQKRPPINVLIVCPTRELANQAAAEANTLLRYHPSIGVQAIMGGTRIAVEQKRMQANPCQVGFFFLEYFNAKCTSSFSHKICNRCT